VRAGLDELQLHLDVDEDVEEDVDEAPEA